ncbi:delta(14)-sterol reductase TM7SF2 [Manduca sexta]|uniref:delta(14)-sterol reductase TM7SF2 n=1 Tax=Manduca sexta TaxID=7130 RepID=UPI00188F7676|nr:delta(14)-sterol reductase TM7SF2 [Manduca sexta]
MSTRSGRVRTSVANISPVRTRKGVSPVRSPARTRKSSPRKSSPARSTQKSPSRKSPSRKPESKFPARKSPSRTTKETKQTAEIQPQVVQKSPSKRPAIKSDLAVRLVDYSSKFESFQSTLTKRSEFATKDVTLAQNEFVLGKVNGLDAVDFSYGLRNRSVEAELTPRRSSRLREIKDKFDDAELRRSVSKSLTHSNSVSKSLDQFSDEESVYEEIPKEKSKSVTRKLATPLRSSISSLTNISSRWEFGGRAGAAALILLMPLTVCSIIISCKHSCSLNIDLNKYKDLQFWLSLRSLGLISSLLVIQTVFAVIPIFGTKADLMDGRDHKYCFNAFFASLFTVGLVYILQYLQVLNKEVIVNEYLQLAATSYIFGFILSIMVYIKSRRLKDNELNTYGNTGYRLYDFFMGREIHCYLKKLNVKVLISRTCNITTLILLLFILSQGIHLQINDKVQLTIENYKEILNKVQLQPTIIVFTIMQIIYILNFIVKEYKITSTFYWQSEGVGYLQIVSSALYPYYFTTISKHVADSKLVLSTNALVFASVLFTLGLFVMLASNNIKHKFRANPLLPSLANLDSMPTFHGNKLLISGLWGVLRHPNYTGDIIIHICLALPGLLSKKYIAAVPAILTILGLGYRVWRDHYRCRSRYGAAWHRYCKKVPSVIIPKIL